MQALARRDRDRRPRRARRSSRPTRSGPSSPSAPTAAPAAAARSSRTCFAEAARERAGEADLVIANHALYFARRRLRGGGRAARARRGRLRRGAPARGVGRVLARRPRLARRRCARLALDVERACREAQTPLPGAALDRVERAGERLLRAVAPPSRTAARCARCRPSRRSSCVDALGDLATALQGQGEDLDALARRALGAAGAGRGVPRAGGARARRLGGARRARVGAGRRLRASCASGSGTTARRRSSSRRRSTTGEDATFVRRRLGLDDAREAVVGSPYDFARAGAALPAARDARPARARASLERAAEEIVALLALSRGPRARAHVELPRARRVSRARARAASRTTCSSRARRRASGCSSASATRSTRCCSRRRRSGRASTSRASRCRCS